MGNEKREEQREGSEEKQEEEVRGARRNKRMRYLTDREKKKNDNGREKVTKAGMEEEL